MSERMTCWISLYRFLKNMEDHPCELPPEMVRSSLKFSTSSSVSDGWTIRYAQFCAFKDGPALTIILPTLDWEIPRNLGAKLGRVEFGNWTGIWCHKALYPKLPFPSRDLKRTDLRHLDISCDSNRILCPTWRLESLTDHVESRWNTNVKSKGNNVNLSAAFCSLTFCSLSLQALFSQLGLL